MNKLIKMVATKQTSRGGRGYTNMSVGKQHATHINIEGVDYKLNEMVPRNIAVKIAEIHNTDFSTRITKRDIIPHGYGKEAKFLVEDCLRIKYSKKPYNRNKAA